MPWFSKTFIAIALHRSNVKTRNKRKGRCESFSERCIAKHLKAIGFKAQWKFGEGERGRYRVDFYHLRARVAVEIDGSSHLSAEAQAYDDRRTAVLLDEYGVRDVLRFKNEEVVCKESRKRVVEAIKTRVEPWIKRRRA